MKSPLNVLIVEDSQDDADLILHELKRAGFAPRWRRVETEADFLAAMDGLPEVILSDYSLPQFSGLRALELLNESGLNIPFVLISGTVGEDAAVEAMRQGAADYLLKDRIARLGSIVGRALEDKQLSRMRQEAEAALRASEEKFRQLAENINEVFWITDPQKRQMLYISPAYERIWGRTCESLYQASETWLEAIHPEDQPRVREAATTKQARGEYEEAYRIVRPDGSVRWILDRAFPVRDAAGEVYRIVGTAEDITRRKELEEHLRQSETEFRVAFDNAAIGVALVDLAGRPLKANRAMLQMLGYSAEELRGMLFDEFTHPEDVAADRELYGKMLTGERENYQLEKRYLRKGGEVIHARLTISVVRGPAGEPQYAVGLVEDITERRKLQAQFIEAQKMEVVGRLAGGVAHDFNNILAIIMGYSDLAMERLGPDGEMRATFEAIRMAAERATALTRQLLVFSRRQTVQPVVLDLAKTVSDMEKMLRRLIDAGIELTFAAEKQAGRIRADAGHIGQLVMNLVINARDAMPDGGSLAVKTSPVTLDDDYARRHPGLSPGKYAMLSVSDTGVGMSDAVKGRLFEAFFTTKPQGKGTGLGLVTCRTIVEQSGGHIEVASEEGKGTTFKVYFPRVDLPLETGPSSLPGAPLPRGTETLLLVEDEPDVRHLAQQVLASQGYHVLTATNGEEALRVVREHAGPPIRLVVTDVAMPRMGGQVMAEWLKESHPGLKILFTSGYPDAAIAHDGVLDPGVDFLPKPYTAANLKRKVREMLDEEAASGGIRANRDAPPASQAAAP